MKIKTGAFPQARARVSMVVFALILFGNFIATGKPQILQDSKQSLVTLRDGDGQLELRLNTSAGCVLDQIQVCGRSVSANPGAYTGVRAGDEWFTSKSTSPVKVVIGNNTVTVSDIALGRADLGIQETWKFTVMTNRIIWQITRDYAHDLLATDMAFPEWNFADMTTWTGGLLDNGGVVWNKYLDGPNATYGGHFRTVTFWNAEANDCLRITPKYSSDLFGAGRFSRQTNNIFSFLYAITGTRLETQHGLNRFLSDRQDLWKPVQTHASKVTAELTLEALQYDQTYNRGYFVGLDGNKIRELMNTVARYGVIDAQLTGGNGWRSGYICLHEPFFGQVAAALDAPDYTANLAAFLDNARDHAIEPNGRVKSRWCYGAWDAMPGTYDQSGFYEAQWGYLMDSQPDYVMNVAELFNVTGDRAWLARHKDSCEQALEFLLRREVGHSGLVAMMTDSHHQNRGSDWIDIIWASYENALINAELYAALNLWAEAETTLGDTNKAADYRAFATRLKVSFNKPISEGGFWDSTNQWYAYWRDKDGSPHGNNLVTPVNFTAIAYGVCDDPSRQKAILDRIETEMTRENLFYWPLSFFPYEADEGAGSNFPFPKYENGDIFLSWGEVGVRAYATYNPALALKYVKNTLTRYAKDGLSFQRYLRQSQQGEGDDILAGNCMPIVGLYRDIYGIQPKPNRLYLNPHLTSEQNGTRLNYVLRGQRYEIELSTAGNSVTAGNFTVRAGQSFGINGTDSEVQYFHGENTDWAMSILPRKDMHLTMQIVAWAETNNAIREWTETATQGRGKVSHVLNGLNPGQTYALLIDGKLSQSLRADPSGLIRFSQKLAANVTCHFQFKPAKP